MIGGREGDGPPIFPVEVQALAEGVFMTAVGHDVVVLDLATDTYACLPDAAQQMVLRDGLVEAELGHLGLLADAGLVGDASTASRVAVPSHPSREMPTPSDGWTPLRSVLFARAVISSERLDAGPTIRTLIESLPAASGRPANTARVGAVTAAFKTFLPWAPNQGACLYRAFVLLTMLRYAGENAWWVFGVRTWPFGAHCWLQIEDAVLDDDPERVSHYTPIMAV